MIRSLPTTDLRRKGVPFRRSARQTLSSLAPLMILALAWSSSTIAQNWETTDWQVSCTAATKDAISNGASGKDATALLEQTCDENSVSGPAALAQHQLEVASVWMRDLGFNGPKINTDHDANGKVRYEAWIDDVSPREKLARESWARYDIDNSTLSLSSGYFFAMGDLGKDAYHIAAPTHEMFHAVQASYPALPFTLDHAWIFEGTASAVMLAWLRQSGHGVAVEAKSRDYDRPLHQPLCGRVSGQTHYGCYATQQFWTWLGSELGSEDNVAYLHDVLQQDLTEKSGLAGVNNALVQWNKDGLYDLYPEFIREVASTPDYFSSAGTDKLTLQYSGKKKEQHLDGQVGPLASNAVQVKIRIPKELSARLTIEFKQDHDDLHLIVDGARLDKNQRQRNHFETTLSGQPAAHEFLVRVANVARNAVDTDPRNYDLEFTLRPTSGASQCTFTATMTIEPLPPYVYYMKNGQKTPISRTESVVGVATISDRHHVLAFSTEDDEDGKSRRLFEIDISPLEIGGPPGVANTRGDVGYGSPVEGDYNVQLNIDQNSDPGDLANWDEMTLKEQIDSGIGYPNRLAMRRLQGTFRATVIETPDCCVGYLQTMRGTFDAGNGPYHCEGGLEAMKNGYEKMRKLINEMSGRKPDPGKLDGLLD